MIAFSCYSQNHPNSQADLSGALEIKVNQEYSFNIPPSGYGNIKEYKINPRRSPIFFKEERNTKWILVKVPFTGVLTFELTPNIPKDDYDWMLFKYSSKLGEEIVANSAMPVRTNNSRNDLGILSRTGMKLGYESTYTKPGLNDAYSKPLEVIKGEQYALVVDNIYDHGGGFKLKVEIKPSFKPTLAWVEGFVKDKRTSKPLKAEVLFEDDTTAFLISKVATDENGYYKALIPANRAINAVALNDSYLFSSDDFRLKDTTRKKLNFFLDTIAKGKKLVLFNVHFQPNKDVIVENAEPELQRLLNFLQSHKDWNIRIIGHTNNNVFADTRYLQQLSFNRAIAVKRFLIKNGIAEKRLSCSGLGGKNPFVKTTDPEEGLKNLRVEIILERKI